MSGVQSYYMGTAQAECVLNQHKGAESLIQDIVGEVGAQSGGGRLC